MFVSLDEIAGELRECEARMAAWLTKVAEFDRSGEWKAAGYLSAAAALRDACRIDPGVAREHVELARKLEQLPEVSGALARGDISRRHAQVVTAAFTPERAAQISDVERELVAAAREHTPKDLGGLVRYLTDAIDGDGGAATDVAQHERRACYIATTLDGTVDIRATCDRATGEVILAAVQAEMDRDLRPRESRTTPQRRLDALAHLARRALDRGDLGDTHGVRPHVTVVVDLEELSGPTSEVAARARAERRRRGHLSAAMLEMITCDCDVARVVMAGRSEILDVGRATRTVSPALWKALVVRDRHCRAPGCERPPDHCEAHHVVHWARGGATDLGNLQLLCWQHHRGRHTDDARARAA